MGSQRWFPPRRLILPCGDCDLNASASACERSPFLQVGANHTDCRVGWEEILSALNLFHPAPWLSCIAAVMRRRLKLI